MSDVPDSWGCFSVSLYLSLSQPHLHTHCQTHSVAAIVRPMLTLDARYAQMKTSSTPVPLPSYDAIYFDVSAFGRRCSGAFPVTQHVPNKKKIDMHTVGCCTFRRCGSDPLNVALGLGDRHTAQIESRAKFGAILSRGEISGASHVPYHSNLWSYPEPVSRHTNYADGAPKLRVEYVERGVRTSPNPKAGTMCCSIANHQTATVPRNSQ